MYILKPISKERIWGTPRLHSYSGDSAIEKIGSVYSASGIREIDNEVVDETVTLGQLIQQQPQKFGLEAGEVYPLIISFTAADENLSIQVHPTDQFAKSEGFPYGKSEAWFFLEAPATGWIYAEQKQGQLNQIKSAIESRQFADVLKEYPVAQFDLVYIPSGTIHALTKGALVYEIQQSTDITYRFYDYDRIDKDGQKRELHTQKALATLQPEQRVEKSDFQLGAKVQQREFILKHLLLSDNVKNTAEIASVLTILSGEISVKQKKMTAGMSGLLLSGEEIQFTGSAEAVLATPISYWRNSSFI